MVPPSIAPPLPVNAGIGLRGPHCREVLAQLPAVGFLEVHSENYFGAGGAPLHYLEKLRPHYPLSLHGVGLSLGSADPLNRAHLRRLRELIDRFQPELVSEHLSWSSIDDVYLNDLLPLPYTDEALAHFSERVAAVQEILGRELLIENPSSYLQYTDSTIPEWEFLAEVARRSGCGLLLDVNNVYVSCANHGLDARTYIDALPAAAIREIHLAGYSVNRYPDGESANAPDPGTGRTSGASGASVSARGARLDSGMESRATVQGCTDCGFDAIGETADAPSLGRGPRLDPSGEILIDSHDAPVSEPVWALYGDTVRRFGPRPTLIEWDTDLPPLAVLIEQAAHADAIAARETADAA